MLGSVETSLGHLKRYIHGLDSMRPFKIYEGKIYGDREDSPVYGDVHFDLQMFIVLSGETDFFLDDVSFKGKKGDVFISSFWEPHAFRRNTEHLHFLSITFSTFSLGSLMPFTDFDWHLFVRRPAAERKISPEENQREEILHLAYKIIETECHCPHGSRSIQWLLIHEIMYYINSKYISDNARYAQSANQIRIFPALELIWHNPHVEIPLNKAASACSMSRSTFCEEFKAVMNESFSHFAMRKRVGYSCMLLRLKKFTIKEVSDQCGFKNITHFYHVFKKFRQCTPVEFISEQIYERQQ